MLILSGLSGYRPTHREHHLVWFTQILFCGRLAHLDSPSQVESEHGRNQSPKMQWTSHRCFFWPSFLVPLLYNLQDFGPLWPWSHSLIWALTDLLIISPQFMQLYLFVYLFILFIYFTYVFPSPGHATRMSTTESRAEWTGSSCPGSAQYHVGAWSLWVYLWD